MDQNIICIAGAHRSGTSMLTRLLQVIGLSLGPEEDLMPAAADNPDGFWENLRFVRLNDEILNVVGASWDLPPAEGESFEGDGFSTARAKARLLIESFKAYSNWGWKDPRNCLTLPFWRSELPQLKTVIIVRNPLEVAYSMNKRNGTSYALGLRLWEIYNRRLLAHTSAGNRIVTNYQTFFDRPADELERIANFIALPPHDSAAAAAIVSKDRRHTSFTKEELIDAGVSPQVITLYDSLLAEASGHESAKKQTVAPTHDHLAGATNKLNLAIPDGETVRRELARRAEEIDRHPRIEALIQELATEKIHAALEVGRRDGRIIELQTAYSHLDQLLQQEYAGRNKLLAELETKREELAEKSQELTGRREQLAETEDQLKQSRERFQQTNQLLHTHSIQLAEREKEVASLAERLRKQLIEMKRLVRLFDHVVHAADLLRHSRRWIAVNPFTWLTAQFTGKELRGFGHIDKNVTKYQSWRESHPEVETLESEIAELRAPRNHSPTIPLTTESVVPPEKVAFKPAPPSRPISFPIHDDIEVSIVIPVFNQLDFTLACLASVQEHLDHIPLEVIVVDDCSSDESAESLPQINGLTYLRNSGNLGFIASCNHGAAKARGRYLVFLNNDTVVTPGWLAALRETFDSEPKAGLVGSKLVYPDGRLQEAGGIIWRDASGWNRGKFQEAMKPEFNFLRQVDYCSAASVMISKSLFESLGGFDTKYAPAYYEDTDLAFKVKAAGRKVFYQPLSRVIHYEGITGGTDTSAGTKKYQEVNRATFAATWASVLATRPVNGDVEAWEELQPGQKRILVIDHHLPMPDRDSGSLRTFQILKILHRLGHRITFLPDNLADIPPYGDNLRKHGIEVVHHPYINSAREYLEKHGSDFDVVILSRCDFAKKHIATVRSYAPQSHIIFDTVDLHFLRTDREASLTLDPEIEQKARLQEKEELALVDQSHETWLVSEVEAALLRQLRPERHFNVVSNIVDVPASAAPFSQRRDFLFIGSFQHTPNIDAVLWFVHEIYPAVRKQLPDAKFYVIGDKAPPEVVALADENVILTGLQPNVAFYFDSIRLSIAPLRFGAGVKGKINQSMAYGVPVVATTLAAEGMGLTDRKEVLIADDPQSFASAVVELYQSEELWNCLSLNSTKVARSRFSPEVAEATLAQLFQDLKNTDAGASAQDKTKTKEGLASVAR